MLQETKDAIAKVRKDGNSLHSLPEPLRANKEIVMAAVQSNGMSIQHAAFALRADPEVVEAAVRNSPWAVGHADLPRCSVSVGNVEESTRKMGGSLCSKDSKAEAEMETEIDLKDDDGDLEERAQSVHLRRLRGLVAATVASEPLVLQVLPDSWRDDEEVVTLAVKQAGSALRYASERLRGEREVVLTAFGKTGWALEHAGTALRDEEDIVLAAVQQTPAAFEYASERLRTSRDFVMKVVQVRGEAYRFAKLPLDIDVLAAAIRQPPTLDAAKSIQLMCSQAYLFPALEPKQLWRNPIASRGAHGTICQLTKLEKSRGTELLQPCSYTIQARECRKQRGKQKKEQRKQKDSQANLPEDRSAPGSAPGSGPGSGPGCSNGCGELHLHDPRASAAAAAAAKPSSPESGARAAKRGDHQVTTNSCKESEKSWQKAVGQSQQQKQEQEEPCDEPCLLFFEAKVGLAASSCCGYIPREATQKDLAEAVRCAAGSVCSEVSKYIHLLTPSGSLAFNELDQPALDLL